MSTSFSLQQVIGVIIAALNGKGLPWVDAQIDDLETRFPDAKPLLETYRALAHTALAALSLTEALPEAGADILATIKAGVGPVDTSGGATL